MLSVIEVGEDRIAFAGSEPEAVVRPCAVIRSQLGQIILQLMFLKRLQFAKPKRKPLVQGNSITGYV